MPRHHHHHHHNRDEPPVPPMPPEPPMPRMGCEGSRGFRFGDFAALVGMSPRNWRGNWGPFHFDFGEEGWSSGGGRGRRAKRMFEGGELRLVLLKLISEQPRHGYDLIRAIEELTGGQYAPSPGVVYPTLTLLEDMGLIEEAPGEGARKPFQITDAGREHLKENSEEAEELIRRLKSLSPSYSPSGGSPVWRAMRNLGVAIRNRLSHGDVTEETVHELAALIDEFAQRVERLK
jgi:DNA-binding PadR family transcriptional regulator